MFKNPMIRTKTLIALEFCDTSSKSRSAESRCDRAERARAIFGHLIGIEPSTIYIGILETEKPIC